MRNPHDKKYLEEENRHRRKYHSFGPWQVDADRLCLWLEYCETLKRLRKKKGR